MARIYTSEYNVTAQWIGNYEAAQAHWPGHYGMVAKLSALFDNYVYTDMARMYNISEYL